MQPKEEAVLKLISEDKSYEDFFFKKVSDLKWFYPLQERGYFNPDKNPSPAPADKEGYYIIPQWNVLDYLERISSQVADPKNDKYINELLEIVKSVTDYKVNGGVTDNYRTWWYFTKILINIPNEKIPVDIIGLIPVWLDSRFGSSLVDADVATKLLPKFFNKDASEDDLKKGELIIDYLTNIKWITKKGVFKDTEEEPKGVTDDHWLKEAFFDKGIAQLIGELGSEEIIYKIANKLKAIFRRHHQINWVDFDGRDKTYRFYLEQKEDYLFNCIVAMYEKKEKGTKKELLESFQVEPEILFEFEINANGSDDFSKKLEAKLEKLDISDNLKSYINNKSKDIYKNVLQDYSYIWLKDFYSQSKFYEIQHILLAIIAISLVEKAGTDVEGVRRIIAKFLSNEYPNPAFTRLVLLVISKQWNTFKDIFWGELFNRTDEPILEIPDFELGISYLFKENVSEFTDEEKQKITELIDTGPQKYLTKNPKGYTIYWKQRWYASLKDDPFFSPKYNDIKSQANFDDTLENDTDGKWIGVGESPFSTDQILKTSNIDIVDYLFRFKEKDKWEDRVAEALGNSLEEAVKNKPEKFAEDLDPFISTGFYYIHHIISGFEKAWENKISFDWSKVLAFIEKYIDRTEFWKNKLKVSAGFYDADNKWVVGAIGELIQEGTRNDEWTIPNDSVPLVKNILSLIASNVAKDERDPNNFPAHILNCGTGEAMTGLLYLILRIARLEKSAEKIKWDENIRKIFEAALSRGLIDAYIVLGEYIANFYYIDKEWIKLQITRIEKIKDVFLWESFMSGYLTRDKINLEIYSLMERFYKKGLKYKFQEKELNGRLIDHIAIAYLNGLETLEGKGLLEMVLEKWDEDQMSELISYFSSLRGSLPESNEDLSNLSSQMRNRIIEFWAQIYKRLKMKGEFTKTDKNILSDLIKLMIHIPGIDEEKFQWLMLSAPYAEVGYNSPHFVEYLNNLKDKGEKIATAKKVGLIFKEAVKSYKPDFDQGDIRSIIEFLYQTEDQEVKRLANEICNEYAKANIEIVSDIYSKYNT